MWNDDMVITLRHMIDDIVEPYKYDDDRLQQLLLVAAQFVQKENRFTVLYTINISNVSLKPDPTKNNDQAFVNLVLLKSAMLLARGRLHKSGSKGSISGKEGSYSYSSSGGTESAKLVVDDWSKEYETAKWEYATMNSIPGEIIIGPYRRAITRADNSRRW